MRRWGLTVAAVSLTLAPTTALAGFKVCVKPPGRSAVAIAPGSSIVVERESLPSLDLRERTTQRKLDFTARSIDREWAQITVDAKAGESFHLGSVAGASCGGVIYQIVNDAKADPREHDIDSVDTEAHVDNAKRAWGIHWKREDHRTWTIAAWATDLAALDGGKAQIDHQMGETFSYGWTEVGVTTIYVRLTSYHVDGTTSIARYKLSRVGANVTLELLPQKA